MGNLTGKSADAGSVEYSRTLPLRRLDLPVTLPHDPSAFFGGAFDGGAFFGGVLYIFTFGNAVQLMFRGM